MKRVLYALTVCTALSGQSTVLSARLQDGGMIVGWQGQPGRAYKLLQSSSVNFGTVNIVTNITSEDQVEIPVRITPTAQYFRTEERIINPLAGLTFYIDQDSNAAQQMRLWNTSDPAKAALMQKIASQPQASWLTTTSGVADLVRRVCDKARLQNAVPLFVAYNIPKRDCNSYSGGGARTSQEYISWCQEIVRGFGTDKVVIIIEPDILAQMDCLNSDERTTRFDLIKQACLMFKAAGAIVYIDAGHSRWHSASTMASRLRSAGIENADGFSLNVSNFNFDQNEIVYGQNISSLVGNAHFVVDSSRNGLGPNTDPNLTEAWCNPPGRALGRRPTTDTAYPLVDAFLWIKKPGESDGNCRPGAPAAGVWWPEYAVGLAERAAY